MQEVGFNLYADMLDHAVRSLKAGREPDLSQPFEVITEVNLHFPALPAHDPAFSPAAGMAVRDARPRHGPAAAAPAGRGAGPVRRAGRGLPGGARRRRA